MAEPNRPEAAIDEETECIIFERLATAGEDAKTAVDSREYLSDLRERLNKHEPAPR